MADTLTRLRRIFPQLDQMQGQLEGLLELVDAEAPGRNEDLTYNPGEGEDADLVEDVYSALETAQDALSQVMSFLEPTPEETREERLASLEEVARLLGTGAVVDAKRLVNSIIEKEGKNG